MSLILIPTAVKFMIEMIISSGGGNNYMEQILLCIFYKILKIPIKFIQRSALWHLSLHSEP